MKKISLVLALVGLFVLGALMCSKADDPEEAADDDTDTSETDTGDDDDNDNEVDTDIMVHFGCVEESGKECLEVDKQGTCVTNELCQWGVEQCLPNGFGCRNEKTKDGCESLGYCVFQTWSNEPCMFVCGTHWDEDSCAADESCEWRGRDCRPIKQSECRAQATEEDCKKVEDCDYVDSCTLAGMCPAITKQGDCEDQEGCVWKDDTCLFECQVLYPTEAECNASGDSDTDTDTDSDSDTDTDTDTDSDTDKSDNNTRLSCRWNPRDMICMNELPFQDFQICRPLEGEECAANEKCRLVQECDLNVSCRELTEEECAEQPKYCTAGLCEHMCTPKKSPQGCLAIDGCMWIEVNYEPGQTCVTACHGETVK